MKVAIAGVWHVHAKGYTQTAMEQGTVVGVNDDNAEWAADFAEKLGISVFASYEELLKSDAEGIIFCSATNRHTEMMVRAAKAGKHIFTEKALALDEEGCDAVRSAVEENGVRFVISFPWKFRPEIMALMQAGDEGRIGKVNYMRFRNCHSGSIGHWLPAHFYNKEECGGGAMIDLGAHGMYLTHWFLGEPNSYTSVFNHFCLDEVDAKLNPTQLEDNAVTVMSYENGAVAVNETGFVSIGSPATLEVGGDKGYLYCNGRVATLNDGKGISELALPEWPKAPIAAFLAGETPCGCGLDEALALTRMMIGAYKNVK